jgi:hypothetical protein
LVIALMTGTRGTRRGVDLGLLEGADHHQVDHG